MASRLGAIAMRATERMRYEQRIEGVGFRRQRWRVRRAENSRARGAERSRAGGRARGGRRPVKEGEGERPGAERGGERRERAVGGDRPRGGATERTER